MKTLADALAQAGVVAHDYPVATTSNVADFVNQVFDAEELKPDSEPKQRKSNQKEEVRMTTRQVTIKEPNAPMTFKQRKYLSVLTKQVSGKGLWITGLTRGEAAVYITKLQTKLGIAPVPIATNGGGSKADLDVILSS